MGIGRAHTRRGEVVELRRSRGKAGLRKQAGGGSLPRRIAIACRSRAIRPADRPGSVSSQPRLCELFLQARCAAAFWTVVEDKKLRHRRPARGREARRAPCCEVGPSSAQPDSNIYGHRRRGVRSAQRREKPGSTVQEPQVSGLSDPFGEASADLPAATLQSRARWASISTTASHIVMMQWSGPSAAAVPRRAR